MGAHAGRLGAKIVSRGKGHSAVSKAAYNARCTLENDRLGTRDDYARSNNQCLFSGIYAPAKSPEWTRDREQLWNHVEAFEKRKDAQLARELVIDLPHELTPEQSRWVMQDFIKENFTRKGLVADLAIHAPHQHGDERNIHAHLLVVLRKLDGTEFAAAKTRQTYAENVAELDGWKRSLEQHMNKALERHGHEARWDLRSNEAKGLDREPEIHLGKAAAALERHGVATAPGDVNRQIRERNRNRAAANENDRAEWVGEQIAEAEASPLHVLEAVQRERDHAAELARADIEAENEPQHRDALPVVDGPDFVSVLDAKLAREARERGDGSDRQARHAMDELARMDPQGTARHFGHHIGDHLKSPEDMRREAERMMRGGVSAELAAAQQPDPLPAPEPVHLAAQSRDQVDEKTPQAETIKESSFHARLRSMGITPMVNLEAAQKPAQEATREPPQVEQPVRQPEPERPAQGPENERRGLFGWFRRKDRTKQPESTPELAADRQHDAGSDRQAEHVTMPAKTPEREPEPSRPAERLFLSVSERMIAEAKASLAQKRAAETHEQQAERERLDELARGRGDGSKDRTRHHHGLLWELFHPFNNLRRRDHRAP